MSDPLRLVDFFHTALQERKVPQVDIELFFKQLNESTNPDGFGRWNRVLTIREQALLGQMLRKDAKAEKLVSAALQFYYNSLKGHFGISQKEIEEFWRRFGLS